MYENQNSHTRGKYVDECSDAAFFGVSKANTYIEVSHV